MAPGDRVGVAVSGGADSVVLLRILHRLSIQFGVELVVLHMNHHLRGAASDGDEAFVRSLAASMDIQFIGGTSIVRHENLEAEARRLRQEFFEHSRQTYTLTRVALGHTRSDQAETVLHRLFRGTGLTGLAAMRLVGPDGLIRPLLTSSRDEIRMWAKAESVEWREDSSNADLGFTRNRLRQETIPALAETYNRNLEVVLANTASLSQAEEDYWSGVVEGAYRSMVKRTHLGSILQIGELGRLHLALRRRLIRRALADIRTNRLTGLDFEHIEAILRLCNSTQGHDRVLVPGADALRSFDSLLLAASGKLAAEPRDYRVPLTIGEARRLPFSAGHIYLRAAESGSSICDNVKEVQESSVQRVRLRRGALTERPLLARNWEPGDELHRLGHKSADKLKTLFQEQRVRLWERRHWPVVVCDRKIVWARDFGPAQGFGCPEHDRTAVELIYETDDSA